MIMHITYNVFKRIRRNLTHNSLTLEVEIKEHKQMVFRVGLYQSAKCFREKKVNLVKKNAPVLC